MPESRYPDHKSEATKGEQFLYYFELTPIQTVAADPFVVRLPWLAGQLSGIFTEESFKKYRDAARRHGFDLTRILRTPYDSVEEVT